MTKERRKCKFCEKKRSGTVETEKFGIRDQIGYVCGDMAGSFVNLYVDAFFLTPCIYVLGIKAIWVGALFLFARLWDVFNDPMIGSLPNRWQIGKSGDRLKPYIRIAMVPLVVSDLLCFTDVSSFGSVAKHVWAAVAYTFCGMSYTGTSMSYGSMAPVIIGDLIKRTKLSRARPIGGTIVGIDGLSLVPQFIFNKAGDVVPNGFMKVAIVLGALSLLSYVLLLRLTTERVRQPRVEGQKFNYGKVLGSVVKNRPMLGVMLATVESLLYITDNSQLGSFLYKEYCHAPQVLTLVSLISVPIMLIFFPIIPKLSQKFGKRNVILFCSSHNLVISVILFLVPIPNVYLFLILNTLAVSGQTAFTMLIWVPVTDCIDYSKYQTGERSDGSVYSIYTFSRKIGSMLASTVASFSLGVISYISGAEAQTETVVHSIRYLCTDIPVVTCILELIDIGVVYNLTKEKTNEMYAELDRKRDVESRA